MALTTIEEARSRSVICNQVRKLMQLIELRRERGDTVEALEDRAITMEIDGLREIEEQVLVKLPKKALPEIFEMEVKRSIQSGCSHDVVDHLKTRAAFYRDEVAKKDKKTAPEGAVEMKGKQPHPQVIKSIDKENVSSL